MVKSSLHGGVGRAQALNVIKIRVFHHEEHEVHEGVYDGILFFFVFFVPFVVNSFFFYLNLMTLGAGAGAPIKEQGGTRYSP